VRQLNEATIALKRRQDTFERQLFALTNNHTSPIGTIDTQSSHASQNELHCSSFMNGNAYPASTDLIQVANSKILQDNLRFAESAFLPFVLDDPSKVTILPFLNFSFSVFCCSLLLCPNRLFRIGICSTVSFWEVLKLYSMMPTPVLQHSQGSERCCCIVVQPFVICCTTQR